MQADVQKQIRLRPDQVQFLHLRREQTGISMNATIRQALDEMMAREYADRKRQREEEDALAREVWVS